MRSLLLLTHLRPRCHAQVCLPCRAKAAAAEQRHAGALSEAEGSDAKYTALMCAFHAATTLRVELRVDML